MSQELRIGPAAELLGVSVGTLRRWEADGKITPERTRSGQRVYRVDDLRALQAGERPAPRATPAPAPPNAPAAPRPAARPAPAPRPPRPRVTAVDLPDASPDLRHILDGLDWGSEVDELPDEAPPAPRPAPRPRRPRADEPAQRVRSARAAVEVQRAARELDELTAQREDAREAREGAQRQRDRAEREAATAAAERARAERVMKPWADEQARERARGERRATVAALLERGDTWAMLGTMGASWDRESRAEARAEVKAALEAEVRHDWSEADVRARVDELLAEWEDEDEE